MTSILAQVADRGEQELILAIRDGDTNALDVLYRRHREDALRFAWSKVGNGHDVEDVLHGALTKTISALGNGYGPHEGFPAYLNTAIKSVAADIWSKSSREIPVEPHDLEAARATFLHTSPLEEAPDAHAHITSAMQSLPVRWQAVLWYAEVLQEPPRRIGPLMGIKANAVSALLKRARAGLRAAYVEIEANTHLPSARNRRAAADRRL